ncbi:hypothetical protein C2S51_034272 [Perilla frutescens var. frutescens]|nr:hypothetical protein C2S51_034272 [Perilla frutescens var. frutescens]
MDGKGNILDYRSRLDKTLSSPDLTNEEMVHNLVKNQILQTLDPQLGEYTDCAVERRSKEVFKFLSELRSASSNDSQSGWKVKQDTEELRVMYREGPEGTPFHTLLAEGYVDGPVDVCMCISWDSDLYKKWWPQIAVPTFRVAASQCVQKVIVGEQIAVVRMKLSWPLSSREVLVHYFAFEYFQDGLIVVLINSISDSETINRSTHGFTRDGIPDAQDVVRMDLYGGFALKKVTAGRSFFRTIANLDIKLDFVPPAFINFVARQLIGSGFKLYKKKVVSAKGDGQFQEALKDPLYTRVREALYKEDTSMVSPVLSSTDIVLAEQTSQAFQDNTAKEDNECDDCVVDSEVMDLDTSERKVFNEIEEFEEKGPDGSERPADEGTQKPRNNLPDEITEEVRTDKMEVNRAEVGRSHEITEHFTSDIKTKGSISPEVQQALGTLEKAISIFREYKCSPGDAQSDINNRDFLSSENDATKEFIPREADEVREKNQAHVESSKLGSEELISQTARNSSDNHGSRRSNSSTRETNQSKIAPASPDEDHMSPSHSKHTDQINVSIVSESMAGNNLVSAYANTINGSKATKRNIGKSRLEQRPFPSARRLFFPNLTSILTRENAVSFVKDENFFSSLSNSVEKLQCWNCGAEADDATSFLFCQACRSIQPVNESIDYFQIFGLGRKYSIEVEELEKKYKDWQKKLHPDLVHSKTQRERKYAAEQSARVIDAYRTLADPLSRATYIVKLEGMPVDEEERINDPELLAEIMELRESVAEAEDAQALNQIQAQLQDKLRYWSNSFEDAYMRKDFEDTLASIRRMTYYKRANEEIVKKL